MTAAGCWEVLWPDPRGVLTAAGLKTGMEAIDYAAFRYRRTPMNTA